MRYTITLPVDVEGENALSVFMSQLALLLQNAPDVEVDGEVVVEVRD